MNDQTLSNKLILPDSFKREVAPARRQNRQDRRRNKQYGSFDGRSGVQGIIVPDPIPSPEHYHLLYHSVKDDVTIPYWDKVFLSHTEAYEEVARVGKEAEPNCEWYEDGRVAIETTLHDRSGLWWIILEPAACMRGHCAPLVRRENIRRNNSPKALFVPPKKR